MQLDRHHAFHPLVLGLEHHAHPTLAQQAQHAVIAEDQPFGLSLIDSLGLILGEPPGLNQGPGQRRGIGGPFGRRRAGLESRNLGRG